MKNQSMGFNLNLSNIGNEAGVLVSQGVDQILGVSPSQAPSVVNPAPAVSHPVNSFFQSPIAKYALIGSAGVASLFVLVLVLRRK